MRGLTQDAARQTTTYTYTAAGNVATVTNPKTETTTYVYGVYPSASDYGRLKQVTGPVAGATMSYGYDSQQRLRTVTDSEGYTRTFDYDAIGGAATQTLDRIAQVTYPDGTSEQTVYNRLDAGWTRDRLGRWTTMTYDGVRHLLSTTDPEGRTTAYHWCTCGALSGIVDAKGNTTSFVRDIESRVTSKVYADGSSLGYTYENSTSRLKQMTNARQQVTHYTYNADDTLAQISYTDASGQALTPPTATISYSYEPSYNRLSSMTDGTGTTSYSYNPITASTALGAGQLASVTGPLAHSTISYGYDELGRVTSRSIDGANNTTATSYDSLGRITAVTNPLGAFSYSYMNTTPRIDHIDYPNGMTVQYGYYGNTGDQRLQEIKNLDPSAHVISQFDYSYDATGEITNWTQNNSGMSAPQHFEFSYDGSSWLTYALLKTGTTGGTLLNAFHYGYDAAGNRTSAQANGVATAWSANNLNQLTGQSSDHLQHIAGTISQPATVRVNGVTATVDGSLNFAADVPLMSGSNTLTVTASGADGQLRTNRYSVNVSGTPSQSFSYDADGNMTGDGSKTYEWDAANRLTAINYTGTSNRSEFTYNGLNQRVQIVEKSGSNVTSTKQFVWTPGEPQPSEERDGNNNVTKRFYPQGMVIVNGNNAGSYCYTRDHLGSIRELTDSSCIVQARYDYDPYGGRTKLGGDTEADFGFTADYYNQPSHLLLTIFRAYSSDTGRWFSRDPMGENGGINLFVYVANNPINLTDFLGLCCDKKTVDEGAEILHQQYNNAVGTLTSNGSLKSGFCGIGRTSCFDSSSLINGLLTPPKCWTCSFEHRSKFSGGSRDHWVIICTGKEDNGNTTKIMFDWWGNARPGSDPQPFRASYPYPQSNDYNK